MPYISSRWTRAAPDATPDRTLLLSFSPRLEVTLNSRLDPHGGPPGSTRLNSHLSVPQAQASFTSRTTLPTPRSVHQNELWDKVGRRPSGTDPVSPTWPRHRGREFVTRPGEDRTPPTPSSGVRPPNEPVSVSILTRTLLSTSHGLRPRRSVTPWSPETPVAGERTVFTRPGRHRQGREEGRWRMK